MLPVSFQHSKGNEHAQLLNAQCSMIRISACDFLRIPYNNLEKPWFSFAEKLFTHVFRYFYCFRLQSLEGEIIGIVECLEKVDGTMTNINSNTFFGWFPLINCILLSNLIAGYHSYDGEISHSTVGFASTPHLKHAIFHILVPWTLGNQLISLDSSFPINKMCVIIAPASLGCCKDEKRHEISWKAISPVLSIQWVINKYEIITYWVLQKMIFIIFVVLQSI